MNKNAITTDSPYRLCFVCLGNICRSPTAEGIFQHLVNEEDLGAYFYIDSAGTSAWHSGERANHNSRKIAEKHGVEILSRARRFEPSDFEEFDLILAMDEQNYRDILDLADNEWQKKRVKMMREFDPQPDDGNVPDPYAGGMDGFEYVYQVLLRSSQQLLNKLKKEIEGH